MRLARLADDSRVPIPPLVELARTRYQRGDFWNTIDLLEPLFEATPGKPDAHATARPWNSCATFIWP